MTTQHTRTAIATSTCLTFGVAVAVAVGAVPQISGSTSDGRVVTVAAPASGLLGHFLRHPAQLVTSAHRAAPHVRRTDHVAHSATTAPAVSAPVGRAAGDLVTSLTVQSASATSTSAEAANIKHAVARHKKHHHKKKHHHHHKTALTKPVLAPRTKPTAAEISNAISGLRNFVHTPFTPTSAQVAEFGDEVCTAFDKNETFSHVKSVILQKVQQLPFTTVTAGAADYVVKTAVALYCPGYKSKVS